MNAPVNIKVFDAEAARADFEILSRQVYGKPLGLSRQRCFGPEAPDRAGHDARFRRQRICQCPSRRAFPLAAATDRYEAARRTVQKFLNAAREDEIVFTKGGTEAINLVSYSFLAPTLQPGDEIVLSVMEHHSNIVPWHFLRERQGAVLRWGRCAR